MAYIKPTYEEYCKASKYAKVRYRYGVFIQAVAVILLLFLIFYTVKNIEEMKANPIDYAEENMMVTCSPNDMFQVQTIYDGSSRNTKDTREW